MNQLRAIVIDLRERHLWPVAAILLVAIVAVPVLLSSGGQSTTVAQLPGTGSVAPPAGVPVVSTGSSPSGGRLIGSARNPFNQLIHGASNTTGTNTAANTGTGTSTGAGASTTSTKSSTTGSAGTSTTGTSTTGSGSTGSGATPTTTIPTGTPKPAPTGLAATQSYDVKLAITNSSGGLDTIDPLERLSVLPSEREPLLVELGVLKGGGRVLFAVQPGAVVGGPGTCIPGPIDCEVLSLGQDQTEALGQQSAGGVVSVALFAVTGVTAANHASAAAANKARQSTSAAGRQLVSSSTSSVLSLFRYESSLGAIVDLRNLTVGG